MKAVKFIVYRYLTDAEFFNLYKPSGTESTGGGQKYIDFRTTQVTPTEWKDFFSNVKGLLEKQVTNGPSWTFPINSIGMNGSMKIQKITVYQRRPASVCISAQHLNVRRSNRVLAWHPQNGFPAPADPDNRHQLPRGLLVYLVRTFDDEIWAGWFINGRTNPLPFTIPEVETFLQPMISPSNRAGSAGFLSFSENDLSMDESSSSLTFVPGEAAPTKPSSRKEAEKPKTRPKKIISKIKTRYKRRERTEEEVIESLFGEDEVDEAEGTKEIRQVMVRIRQRNQKAVQGLKVLYQHKCQVTGTKYLFRKKDGNYYTEAHHLIPIGSGGADNPRNVIIVSPLVHRMFHYADVSDINLSEIQENRDGSAKLEITINSDPYTIVWHPRHAERVLSHSDKS